MNSSQHSISIIFRGNLFDVIGCSTSEILHIGTLAVEIWKNYDFLLVVLAQILGDDHISVRIVVVEFNNEMVASKVVRDLSFQGSAGEPPPEDLLPFGHRLVWLGNTAVKVQVPPLLDVRLELPGKFFFVVLFELFLDDADDCGYAFIFTLPQKLIHFFVGIVSGVQVNKAFEGCVLFVIFKLLFSFAFLPVVCNFFQHIGKDVSCTN